MESFTFFHTYKPKKLAALEILCPTENIAPQTIHNTLCLVQISGWLPDLAHLSPKTTKISKIKKTALYFLKSVPNKKNKKAFFDLCFFFKSFTNQYDLVKKIRFLWNTYHRRKVSQTCRNYSQNVFDEFTHLVTQFLRTMPPPNPPLISNPQIPNTFLQH